VDSQMVNGTLFRVRRTEKPTPLAPF